MKDFSDRSPFGRCGREGRVRELGCVRGLLDTGGGVGAWSLGVRAPRALFVFRSIRGHGNWRENRNLFALNFLLFPFLMTIDQSLFRVERLGFDAV